MGIPDNPCLPCHSCCTLDEKCGLRLSKEEFDTFFKGRQEGLQVRMEDKIVILSSKEGLVCPNLGEGGCRIYLDRPIDCRLYPYQMELLNTTRSRVEFIFHSQSKCPRKNEFLYPEEKAKALIKEFGRKVYGTKKLSFKN